MAQIWKVRPVIRKIVPKYLLKHVIYIWHNIFLCICFVYIYVCIRVCWNILSLYVHMHMCVCIFLCWMSTFWQILKLFEKHRLQFMYINPPRCVFYMTFTKKKQILSCTLFFLEGIHFLVVFLSSDTGFCSCYTHLNLVQLQKKGLK